MHNLINSTQRFPKRRHPELNLRHISLLDARYFQRTWSCREVFSEPLRQYASAWVKRHGNIHGAFTRKNFENRELAQTKFGMDDRGDSRGVLRVIAELAIKNTARKARRR